MRHEVWVDPTNPDHGALALAFASYPDRPTRRVVNEFTKGPGDARRLEIGERAQRAEICELGNAELIGGDFR